MAQQQKYADEVSTEVLITVRKSSVKKHWQYYYPGKYLPNQKVFAANQNKEKHPAKRNIKRSGKIYFGKAYGVPVNAGNY